MIKAGQRVFVELGPNLFEGVVLEDCEDWGAEELVIREESDGKVYRLATWNASEVEIMDGLDDEAR